MLKYIKKLNGKFMKDLNPRTIFFGLARTITLSKQDP